MLDISTAQNNSLSIENFIREKALGIVVDVRSPVEYKTGHIPGAINIPLFDDHERSEIGTLYKLKGKEEAVLRGIEIVSPKLAEFIRSVKGKQGTKEIVYVYCFRGGMRSGSFCWLMDTAGINALKLDGGYKRYRNEVLDHFAKPHKFFLIGGSTGSGKTDVLKKIKELGAQTVDLEGIAHHKGSVFGFIGQKEQPTQQQFENELFANFIKNDIQKDTCPADGRIFLEDESFAIGSVKLPYALWLQMKEAPIVKINVPFELRVKRLVNEYATVSIETLKKPLLQIRNRLGPQHYKTALEHLEKGEFAKVAEITLHYYDKAYDFSHEKRNYKNVFPIDTHTDDPETNAKLILDFVNQKKFLQAHV